MSVLSPSPLLFLPVQLEDDIVAKPNYLSTMRNFALQQPSEDWMILEFSQLGFIGRPTPAGPIRQVIALQPAYASPSTISQPQYLSREPCWKCPLCEDVPGSPALPCPRSLPTRFAVRCSTVAPTRKKK